MATRAAAVRAYSQPRKFTHPTIKQIKLRDVLFALSDPTRLAIARELGEGPERTSGGLLEGSVPKSTMSHHLKILREAGVTRTRVDGLRCYVSLRRDDLDKRYPGLFELLIRYADPVSVQKAANDE